LNPLFLLFWKICPDCTHEHQKMARINLTTTSLEEPIIF
jgi:hypothetical protein